MMKLIGFFSGQHHRFDAGFMQGSDIDIQCAADGSDLHHILRLIRHDRTSAAGQKHIGHIVDGDIVGNIVYQGDIFSYIFTTGF